MPRRPDHNDGDVFSLFSLSSYRSTMISSPFVFSDATILSAFFAMVLKDYTTVRQNRRVIRWITRRFKKPSCSPPDYTTLWLYRRVILGFYNP
ncbi:hypothetical protein TIFTF001_023220 [Ficus carica]|uniref:Uncharacterized protein n=1 Tax=Ficus carica TaxID=3494 RepID=A0AA88AUE5_FICCA|nr:hypothetical protein TIFTF001_023220 [Ficus carica]